MDLSQGVFHNNSKGIRRTPPFFTTSDCSGVGSDQEKKGEFRRRGGGHTVDLFCSCWTPPTKPNCPPPSVGFGQTLCPQHSHPSQTRAPVNTGSPCDYTRLGTGREENQPVLLFQQVWITESILPPNLLLLLLLLLLLPSYSSRSAASLLSHTPGGLWLLTPDGFWGFFLLKYLTLEQTANN